MPHSGDLLSLTGTLRGEGPVRKRNNALYVEDADDDFLLDDLGLVLQDENSLALTD